MRVTFKNNGSTNTMLFTSFPQNLINSNTSITYSLKIGARNLLETSIKNGSHSLKLGSIEILKILLKT
jgi:hypothetical protein